METLANDAALIGGAAEELDGKSIVAVDDYNGSCYPTACGGPPRHPNDTLTSGILTTDRAKYISPQGKMYA